MIGVNLVGATGYTGKELLWLLANHSQISKIKIVSRNPEKINLQKLILGFDLQCELEIGANIDINNSVTFLCLPHGESKKIIRQMLDSQYAGKIIDLSQDYRYDEMGQFVYGLTDFNKQKICQSQYIANPGCFATAIQSGLLPFVCKFDLNADVHITAITGSTGAGIQPSETSHYSWRSQNVSIYKNFEHQHLREIYLTLDQASPHSKPQIYWVPIRGNFARGIFVSLYFKWEGEVDHIRKIYREFYHSSPFTKVVDFEPSLKGVVNTNQCHIYLQKNLDVLHVTIAIDNLLKGAAGQALENMNITMGFDQKMGLLLKPSLY